MRPLAVVLAAVVIAVSCSNATPTPTPTSTDPNGEWQPTTAWEKTLARIRPDGSVDLDTALVAFSLAIAPLPGVALPPEDPGLITDGTVAVRWLRSHWDELTDAQQTEAQRHLVPPGQPGAVAEAVPGPSTRLLAGLATVALGQRIAIDAIAAPSPPAGRDVEAAKDAAIAAIGTHFERRLTIEVQPIVNTAEQLINDAPAFAYTSLVDLNGGAVGAATECYIYMNPRGMAADDVLFTEIVAHEVFHCFQGAFYPSLREDDSPSWVEEGQAEWVGDTIAKELTGSNSTEPGLWWESYLLAPKTSLMQRAYDAIGFYARLDELGQDPWLILDPMLAAQDGPVAFQRATEAIGEDFADSWASGFFRDPGSGRDWDIAKGIGLPPGVETKPTLIPLANGDATPIEVEAYANAIFQLDGPADVARFRIDGRARLIDRTGYPVVGLYNRDFCLKDPCECPPKMHFKVDPPGFLTPQLKIAVSGSTEGALGSIVGVSLDELCERDDSEDTRPCAKGCGLSNGDPHLRTVNGHGYEFMAAGEFTLLRSGDGAVEVQARQEPYKDKRTVSINTAAAVRANGRRVAVYESPTGVLELRIDGVQTSLTQPIDLGGGASVTPHPLGIEVHLPDGSVISAFSLGRGYGINVAIAAAESLRETGAGLLGSIPRGADLPRLPDGTVLPFFVGDGQGRLTRLFGQFADAWRVTDASSLFDYAPGTTAATFTKPDFPDIDALLRPDAIPLELVPGAREACGAITDPLLFDQCVFDVAVTNNVAFANQYALSQRFMAQGSAALIAVAPPGGTAPPSPRPLPLPTPGGSASSVIQLLPSLLALHGQALGPDGTLYLSVEHADNTFEVLAVDAEAGTIVRRSAAAGGGQVVFAAGSVWVGEYSSGGCSVTRLDAVSLAAQATVATGCTSIATALAGTRDSVWFHDPTGLDLNGKGAHLRRIDPHTNALATEVPLPYAFGYLTASASHVFYGDRGVDGRGFFRLPDGGATLEPLGSPVPGPLFPVGDGVWAQDGGTALRFATVAGASQRIDIVGSLVAADLQAVYSAVPEYPGAPASGRLWRFPLAGGQPMVIATSSSRGSGSDHRTFDFSAPGPLLVSDTGIVKLFLSYTSDPGGSALALLWVPLP